MSREDLARVIYRAMGFDPAYVTETAKGIAYGNWAKAGEIADAVLSSLSAPPAPAPIEAEAVETLERIAKVASWFADETPDSFCPDIGTIPLGEFRKLRAIISALRAPAPAAEPSRFKSPLADAVAKKVHNEMASLRSVTGVTIDTVAQEYRIVCDGFPSHEGPRFIEVEDETGKSIKAGEWRKREDGLCELVISAPAPAATDPDDACPVCAEAARGRADA